MSSEKWSWAAVLVLALTTACSFPRPADVASSPDDDDSPTGCTRDEDCSRSTPFCVDTVCAVCKTDSSCPATAPVCDQSTHDCRTCLKDAECASGACDLAAGTCVEQGKILYASPGGTVADPCTKAQPCSFARAVTAADPAHTYVVLAPGMYTESAQFNVADVTMCGGGATFDASAVYITGGAPGTNMRLRNFKMRPPTARAGVLGQRTVVIYASHSNLVIEDADLEVTLPEAINGGPSTIIRNTTISHGIVSVFGDLIVDRSTFTAGAAIGSFGNDKKVTVLNSVFISSAGANAITINSVGDMNSNTIAYIANNTFSNGAISCNGTTVVSGSKIFEANIFYNIDTLANRNDCYYSQNLILPLTTVVGKDNITGDPKFVDAAHNDFHLQPGSPAIDVGSANPAHPNGHDRDGKPRPAGTAIDLGAYEVSP
jgi:hypothetical protein